MRICDYQTAKRTLARFVDIKALGKENITDDAIIRLRNRTDCLDKDVVLQEARYTTSWIFAVIKKICEKDME